MKNKLTVIGTLTTLAVFTALGWGDDISNNIQTVLALNQDKPLNALAQDLGALLGGGSFRSGKVLGFPLGLDVGGNIVIQGVQKDDLVLRDDASTAKNAFGQVELGLPMKLNAILRIGKAMGGNLLGGGISYGILKPSLPGLPALSISALYNQLKNEDLEAKTYSGNAVLSIDFPLLDPYLGAGYDYTKATPTDHAFQGLPASVDRNQEGKSGGYRLEGGVNLHLIPFTYINLGAGIANGEEQYHAGVGIRI